MDKNHVSMKSEKLSGFFCLLFILQILLTFETIEKLKK